MGDWPQALAQLDSQIFGLRLDEVSFSAALGACGACGSSAWPVALGLLRQMCLGNFRGRKWLRKVMRSGRVLKLPCANSSGFLEGSLWKVGMEENWHKTGESKISKHLKKKKKHIETIWNTVKCQLGRLRFTSSLQVTMISSHLGYALACSRGRHQKNGESP